MPRQARLDAPGALHHIMVRGINKSAIFKDDQDKTRFLERLGEIILKAECAVFAWVLMDNHAISYLKGNWGRPLVFQFTKDHYFSRCLKLDSQKFLIFTYVFNVGLW
jgi:hypothetical protein